MLQVERDAEIARLYEGRVEVLGKRDIEPMAMLGMGESATEMRNSKMKPPGRL